MSGLFSKQMLSNLPRLDSLSKFVESNKQLTLLVDQYNKYGTWQNFLKLFGLSAVGFSLYYLLKIWWSHQFFKRRGIKTPPFRFFYGNFPEIRKNNLSDILREWTSKYGQTYGYYHGHLPILVTSDLELIQEVFIKQYSNFSARRRGPLGLHDNDPSVNLFNSTKSRWKRMRNIMNPTFSTAKLRELSPLMLMCVNRLDQRLEQTGEKEINVTDYLKRFTMDTIWNCAFGLDINLQFDRSKDIYYQKCEQLFQDLRDFNIFLYIGIYFHEIKAVLTKFLAVLTKLRVKLFNAKNVPPTLWLNEKVHEIVSERIRNKVNRNDYIKLLLDAQTNESIKDLSKNELSLTTSHIEKKLSTKEINTNLSLFMIAGYETTSTTLTYACYILARHPEEQETLYNDIVSQFPEDSDVEPEIDTVQNCKYLDMFIKEVLRLYPIANAAVTRRCTNATTVKGIEIPIDMAIAVDVLSVHFDEEIWGPQDPKKFDPLRHSPEYKRNPIAFMGFGIGPRNCIGMKFALQELKFTLVKILRKYEVVPGPNTPTKVEIIEGGVRSPKGGMNVIFKKRK